MCSFFERSVDTLVLRRLLVLHREDMVGKVDKVDRVDRVDKVDRVDMVDSKNLEDIHRKEKLCRVQEQARREPCKVDMVVCRQVCNRLRRRIASRKVDRFVR